MKTFFKSQKFYYLLICFIIGLIIWNLYSGIKGQNFWAILPVSIQSVLLALILTHNRYARISILIWAIIFIIGAPALGVLTDTITVFDEGFEKVNINGLVENLVSVVLGILIVDFTRRTVKVLGTIEAINLETGDFKEDQDLK